MKEIIIYGSINTDLVFTTPTLPEAGETLPGDSFFISYGGKGANQAVGAARLGGKVSLIGCVGNDAFGHAQLAGLKAYGVNTSGVQVIDNQATGTAVIMAIENRNHILTHTGANTCLVSDHFTHFIKKEMIHSGIFVTQLESDLIETEKAITHAKQQGFLTILNPAPAIEIEETILQSTDILVLNQQEAEVLSGVYPLDVNDASNIYKQFQALGVETMILLIGKKGSLIFNGNHMTRVPSYDVEAVDITASEDAYVGAIAYGLSQDWSMKKSAQLAAIVSSLAVTKKGAQAAMPTLEDVEAFKKHLIFYD